MSCAASVAQTASDALKAKQSALTAGYQPVQPNADLYANLLSRACPKEIKLRRQTPLVNAGYAVRMAAVSGVVRRFMATHHGTERNGPNPPINIALIGCGMDVLGFWASALSPTPSKVSIYEIDCIENCSLKREALIAAGMVVSFDTCDAEKVDDSTVLGGKIKSTGSEEMASYMLLSADLRKVSSVRDAMKANGFNSAFPTLVVSELVLAYLGTSSVDSLLQYASRTLCISKESLFFAYEPIGGQETKVGFPRVAHDYVAGYSENFCEKINRGRHDKDDDVHRECFDVLGRGCANITHRLAKNGFEGPIGCSVAGHAASELVSEASLTAKEYFDEHTDLNLHLHAYGVTCAFSTETGRGFALDVCPWLDLPSTSTMNFEWSDMKRSMQLRDGTILKISPIDHLDQAGVRSLFRSNYAALAEEYPSVNKLLRHTMKITLSEQMENSANKQGSSAIKERFGASGGGFWVAALKNSPWEEPLERVGFIGIRKSMGGSGEEKKAVYEIQHLIVGEKFRGMGIGRALLGFAERFVLMANPSRESEIVATTLSLLEGANQLYPSCGFVLESSTEAKGLTYNTYRRSC